MSDIALVLKAYEYSSTANRASIVCRACAQTAKKPILARSFLNLFFHLAFIAGDV